MAKTKNKKTGEGESQRKVAASTQPAKSKPTGIVGKVKEFIEFFEESKVEIKKVVWPSRKETVTTCIAVIVLTIVMALYLGLVDLGLSKIVEAILS